MDTNQSTDTANQGVVDQTTTPVIMLGSQIKPGVIDPRHLVVPTTPKAGDTFYSDGTVFKILPAVTDGIFLSGDTPSFLAPGTEGQVVTIVGGVPAYATPVMPTTGVTVLDRNTTTVTVNNTNAETTLYTYSVAANKLGATNWIRLTMFGTLFNNTGSNQNVTLKLKYGTTTIITTVNILAAVNATYNFEMHAVLAAITTATQKGNIAISAKETTNGGLFLGYGYGTGSEDDTTVKNLVMTVTLGISDTNLTFVNQAVINELL